MNTTFKSALQEAVNKPVLPSFANLYQSKGLVISSSETAEPVREQRLLILVKYHQQVFCHIDRERNFVSVSPLMGYNKELANLITDIFSVLGTSVTCAVGEATDPTHGTFETIVFYNAQGEQIGANSLNLDYKTNEAINDC